MPVIHEMPFSELQEKLRPDLRILVVAVSGAWGGLEQTALSDAKALVKLGFAVVMFVKEGSALDEQCQASEVPLTVERYPYQVRKFIDPNFVSATRKALLKHKINLVHCHQGSLVNSIVPALTGLPGIAFVLSRHILNNHKKKDLFHVFLYRRVDYILVLSETMKRNILHTFPVPEKKLRIVNLGLDTQHFNSECADPLRMRANWNIPAEKFLVGVVGRLDPMKRQDLLIKALASLREQIGNIHGVIVGAETPGLGGSYIRSLEQTIKDLRMADAISIVGPQTRIPEVMASLNLFVMPSQEEAFGLVALEAMAMGVPAVLSQAGSAEELARGGRGELFRPGDAFDLSRKIKKLYESPETRASMASKAKAYVVDRFTTELRLHRTLEVYMRCARRRRLEHVSPTKQLSK